MASSPDMRAASPAEAAGDLRAQVETQQAQIAQQEAQIAALIERQSALESLIARMTTPEDEPTSPGVVSIVEAPDSASPDQPRQAGATSRRALLKWGGLGAAAALAVAGSGAFGHEVAQASSGGDFMLGENNVAENVTGLFYDGSNNGQSTLLVENTIDPTSTGIQITVGQMISETAYGGIGLYVTTGDSDDTTGASSFGVRALAGNGGTTSAAYGLWGSAGQANAIAVFGEVGYTNGPQIAAGPQSGSGAAGTGVYGASNNGYGVMGVANTGIDIAAFGTGRFYQVASGFVGAPTTGSYLAGEQIRDNDGTLFICVAGGTPGVWLKVITGGPGISGAVNFLDNPIRLLDTRNTSPWLASSNHTLQVGGVDIDGIVIPTEAIGVVGNVTVVNPTAGGDLRLYPGPRLPATSSINFATGQIIANGVTVALNSSGQMLFQVDMPSGAHTNVLFDASGYIS